ncbi:MAG: tyrosine-protein phosphatase [Acidobacteria bacterium]|nr:tyrosine-protein phosphatase [Acidobacteriota bacterium]
MDGVQNFGRVTDSYFRGGEVTPAGVDALANLGVRTIIDLRDEESPGEAEACQRNGIKYFKFPMSGHATPDDRTVDEILSIIQQAKEPIYVHCSAGKHRAGTIAALYRTRVQGWSKERAWAEQKSYGFGPPEGHPMLYAFVYGGQTETVHASTARLSDRAAAETAKEKSSKKMNKKDDDDDDIEVTWPVIYNEAGLSSSAGYISVADVIKRAKAEGANGDVLKIDLEWDDARSIVTWDVTFSSGDEYEFDAGSGKHLGTKSKAPAKLATLSPLSPVTSDKSWLTFQEIIRKAEASRSQKVTEMELKQIKGRPEILYEVVLADGTTIYYDATTGKAIEV